LSNVSCIFALAQAKDAPQVYLIEVAASQHGMLADNSWEQYYSRRDVSVCIAERTGRLKFTCNLETASEFAFADQPKQESSNTVRHKATFHLDRGQLFLEKVPPKSIFMIYDLPESGCNSFFLPMHRELTRESKGSGVVNVIAPLAFAHQYKGTWVYRWTHGGKGDYEVYGTRMLKSGDGIFTNVDWAAIQVKCPDHVFIRIEHNGVVAPTKIYRDQSPWNPFRSLMLAEKRTGKHFERSLMQYRSIMVPIDSNEASLIAIPSALKGPLAENR
jgi:hypothetical protein